MSKRTLFEAGVYCHSSPLSSCVNVELDATGKYFIEMRNRAWASISVALSVQSSQEYTSDASIMNHSTEDARQKLHNI